MIMTDANANVWERRWFVLRRYVGGFRAESCTYDFSRRPYLHIYAHSNEVVETGVVNLNGVNIESNPEMEALLGVRAQLLPGAFSGNTLTDNCPQKRFTFTLFTASNSYALAAPSQKELQAWTTKLDPTRLPS